MTGASLLVFLALGQFPTSDADSLVPRLGAPRYSEREGAAGALMKLGRRALPALRSARDDKDPEVRSRAAALVAKIEGALLTQPTMINLDFEDRPLPEVLRSLNEQAGITFSLVPENSPIWTTRRVTVHEPTSLPFWKAVDRLCEVARLQYNTGMYGMAQGRQATFPLFDGGGPRATIPTVDTGPFRVSITNLHYQRDVTFPAGPPRPGLLVPGPRVEAPGTDGPKINPLVTESCHALVQIQGEPRLSVSQNGALKITEAVDDKGQSLLSSATRGVATQRTSGYFGTNAGSLLQLQAALTRPERPGQTIRKLRGVLPVAVATRKPNPLTVKLEGATNKTFRNEDVVVTFGDVRPLGNTQQTVIELSARHVSGNGGAAGTGMSDFGGPRPDAFGQTIEVIDGQGRLLPWYQTSIDTETSRVTIAVTPQAVEGHPTPAELRFYSMARATSEVEFEFNDLPLP